MNITIENIQYLRKMTGAGVMDCKNALNEAMGNYNKAIEIIRKKGKAIANKRENREASEGCALAACKDHFAVIVSVKCETDFVAKEVSFVNMVKKILFVALKDKPKNIEELNNLSIDGSKISDLIIDRIRINGEKIELWYYDFLIAPSVVSYVHTGNKIAVIVGFNQLSVNHQVAKDVAMQVAAMNPIAVCKNSIPKKIIEREKRIAREKAKELGKPEMILDRIEDGALNKYYKEYTLLLQDFIKDPKITVNDFLKKQDANMTVTDFRRISLNVE